MLEYYYFKLWAEKKHTKTEQIDDCLKNFEPSFSLSSTVVTSLEENNQKIFSPVWMANVSRMSEWTGFRIGKRYPSSREVEVSSPLNFYLPSSEPACKLGTFRSAQAQKNARVAQNEDLLKLLNRLASKQVDFWAGDTFNQSELVKGKLFPLGKWVRAVLLTTAPHIDGLFGTDCIGIDINLSPCHPFRIIPSHAVFLRSTPPLAEFFLWCCGGEHN